MKKDVCPKCGSKCVNTLEYTNGNKLFYCYRCGYEEPVIKKEVTDAQTSKMPQAHETPVT